MKNKEEWKRILGWESFYLISSYGRVYSIPRQSWTGNYYRRTGGFMSNALDTKGYPFVLLKNKGKVKLQRIHRAMGEAFLGVKKGQDIDHINGERSHNFIDNLRVCSRSQNCANRKSKNNHKGVSRSATKSIRWNARIVKDGKQISLGSYGTINEASIAYNNASIKYFGEFGVLNKVS